MNGSDGMIIIRDITTIPETNNEIWHITNQTKATYQNHNHYTIK